ncbi:hypothetical protein FNF27_04724 [Cafeteria roenbergensis]|uniref:DUF1731 domain-containing protein n=1 Tax=Cafeteria roenbergensis TaxID=33653 RepID=A0A5A8DIT0_CAFRO|nr:hypothetical protein FNF29_05551 [Cafeteria roenbergensis]KAA0165325.1 hypothetical protein FNF31_01978 [Cafeteria roenbergensis]KAA0173776.1 hypothetical protein FNF27_04724 [Cafeteria roenbergensis]|eukprot:KAA0150111.1 hypothetical protein FNF29_05551 [Cafeteria roenbergensis]
MVGTALIDSLRKPSTGLTPHISRLVRHDPRGPDEVFWDPYEMRIDIDRVEGFDAVVHLAGENIGDGDSTLGGLVGRWSDRKRHRIMESRRRGTKLLSKALASLKAPPSVMVSASGVGYYGSRGDTVLDDDASKGAGFLSDVAEVWERETQPAADCGVRVVNLRFGVVLSSRGGVVQKLYMPYLFGLGGPVGPGSQYMSWITLGDAVRAIEHSVQREELEGPVNACAPNPCTSAEFASAFGGALGRPALIPLPTPVVKGVFGEMGDETLLVSQRAVPTALLASGFRFWHNDIRTALKSAVSYHSATEPATHG